MLVGADAAEGWLEGHVHTARAGLAPQLPFEPGRVRRPSWDRETAGLKRRRPFHRTAPHWPLGLLWRLRAGRSNPKLPPGGSDAKEAPWKAAGEGDQNEPSAL